MLKTIVTLTSLSAIALCNAACSHRTVPDAEFGKAVRDVMNSQIHDYEAAVHPNPEAVEGSDPDRLNNVIETYREDIAKPEEVREPISISIGGG